MSAPTPSIEVFPTTRMSGAPVPSCKHHAHLPLQFAWKKKESKTVLKKHFYWCSECDGNGPAGARR